MKTAFSPPLPRTTLIIILGASGWPDDEAFEPSKAFEHAAHELEKYFLTIFGLPKENLLWLFDTTLNARDIDKEICKHLDTFGAYARDVFVYYTGHGRPTDDRSSLYLAIRDTQAHDPEGSSLSFKSLARTLKAKARHLRRFYVLDCCFAALGQSTLQGASVFDELCQRTLKDIEVDLEIPSQGYAGLFSSGKEEMSVILPTHENTFFTQAFLQVLLEGSLSKKPYFSLKDVYNLIEDRLDFLYKDYRSRYPRTLKPPTPQLYAGNIASLPFFPNTHAEIELHSKAEDTLPPDVLPSEIKASKRATPAAFSKEPGEHPNSVFDINTAPGLNPSIPNMEDKEAEEANRKTAQSIRESAGIGHERLEQGAPLANQIVEESRASIAGERDLDPFVFMEEVPGASDHSTESMKSEIENLGDRGDFDFPDPPPPARRSAFALYSGRSDLDEDEGFPASSVQDAIPMRSARSLSRRSPRIPRPRMPDGDEDASFSAPSARAIPARSTRALIMPSSLTGRRLIPDFDENDKSLSSAAENIHIVATPPSRIKASFRRAVDFLFGTKAGAQSGIAQSIRANPIIQTNTEVNRRLYTVLDVGTAYAKAMIVEVQDEIGVVLGVGRYPQSYWHMSGGIVTDISGVIANCNEALLRAEEAAGGLLAPNVIIGIAGELVKGSTITASKQRQNPTKQIMVEELEALITAALIKLLKSAKEQIAAETGYSNIDIRLTNAAVLSMNVDGQFLSNPVGFRGQNFTLTLFSAFAPLMQLGALETVAQGLDLTLVRIVAEPYALARCLSHNTSANSGAIFIDIGAGQTNIALVRQGRIEETQMFALGGRTFTRRIATSRGISIKEAERLKFSYSSGSAKGYEKEEIQNIFAPEVETWMESIELLLKEMARGESLPPAVYIVGGGSALPDLSEKLESFPWTKRLPFSHQPIIQTIQPEMVTSISDPNRLLNNVQDIAPMALAHCIFELQDKDSILERALDQVIHNMHISIPSLHQGNRI